MKLHHTIQRLKVYTVASLVVLYSIATPLITHAEELTETTPEPEQSIVTPESPTPTEPVAEEPPVVQEPQATTTGPTSPVGESRDTYQYNDTTGLWENEHYTWGPVTKQTLPKTTSQYAFNPATNMWETTEWEYDAAAEKYIPRVVQISPIAPSEVSAAQQGSAAIQIDTNATVQNRLNACSNSGNASVHSNTHGGSATSGDAYTMANILNLLGSSWGELGGAINTFTTDINGNVTGDIHVNPTAGASSNQNARNNLSVNAQNNGSITNQILLCALSGNASVSKNTTAGDATSGNANAVINLLNLINSSIEAGESFVGVMNINGNFDGDILLPEYLRIDNLINPEYAAEKSEPVTLAGMEIENSEVLVDVMQSSTINNSVDTDATSGTAGVTNNNTAGSAQTGGAQTNVTLLNLTGREITGKNGLLVFVNVLGTWVGFIVDSPHGSTTAALGNGVTKSSSTHNTATLIAENNQAITNDVIVRAQSGDASVDSNTQAGSATSGNASASANILNLIDSRLSLSDWFGVLFINVFGSWQGSFGVDTSSGTLAALQTLAETGTVPVEDARVFSFSPSGSNTTRLHNVTEDYAQPTEPESGPTATLASAEILGDTIYKARSSQQRQHQQSSNTLQHALNFGGIATLSYLGADQLARLSRKKRNRL